jgi:CcmD family protein
MNKMKFFLTTILTVVFSIFTSAQDTSSDIGLMRSNGKIFVVMAVVLTILIGLFAYLISIDKKITRLEKEG